MERIRMRPLGRFGTVAWLLCVATAALAEPTADQVLTDFGSSAGDKQRVLHGEYITAKMGAVSERDLSFAIAFFLKTSPDALSKQVIAGDLMTADPQVKAYGALSAPESPGDPAKLARALITISGLATPPQRFIAGADAVTTAEQVAADLKAQTDAHRELSRSLAFD